jgi:hypothetical protein
MRVGNVTQILAPTEGKEDPNTMIVKMSKTILYDNTRMIFETNQVLEHGLFP